MEAQARPIGVFDSGLGGISVLRACVRLLPQENFLFFGDSANAPYGEKSLDQVRALTLSAVDRLLEQGVKGIVVACNNRHQRSHRPAAPAPPGTAHHRHRACGEARRAGCGQFFGDRHGHPPHHPGG